MCASWFQWDEHVGLIYPICWKGTNVTFREAERQHCGQPLGRLGGGRCCAAVTVRSASPFCLAGQLGHSLISLARSHSPRPSLSHSAQVSLIEAVSTSEEERNAVLDYLGSKPQWLRCKVPNLQLGISGNSRRWRCPAYQPHQAQPVFLQSLVLSDLTTSLLPLLLPEMFGLYFASRQILSLLISHTLEVSSALWSLSQLLTILSKL